MASPTKQSPDLPPAEEKFFDGDVDLREGYHRETPFPEADKGGSAGSAKRRVLNQVQLSAYPDHIGESLLDLESFLEKNLQDGNQKLLAESGVVTGLHLLPIYPSSGDGGFAPITYKEIDPRFGAWADVDRLAAKYDLELECMVNHVSPKSHEFQDKWGEESSVQDFLEKGDASPYADMFIDWNKFWGGEPSPEDLAKIRTRKPAPPFIEVTLKSGEKRKLWCTFGPEQIDINPFSEPGFRFLKESLETLCKHGAKIIRCDAFGYCTKKRGTRSFFEEPEAFTMLEKLSKIVEAFGTVLLCEVHEEYRLNIKLARKGYWVYDFALPLLVLHAFTFQTAVNLKQWVEMCPRRQITVLDTHDGMGIDDIGGLADVADVDELAETVVKRLGCAPNFKYFYQNGKYVGAPHQYNCTYLSALKGNPQSYLLARAIQFWTPGIPMVYYCGLLGALNDWKEVEKTGNSRDINRHRYSIEEAQQALTRPVVKALLQLCQFRNRHKAFAGQLEVGSSDDDILDVTWVNGEHRARLQASMQTRRFEVYATRHHDTSGEITCTRYHLNEHEEAEWEEDHLQPEEQSTWLRAQAARFEALRMHASSHPGGSGKPSLEKASSIKKPMFADV